ncbi:MAG: NAD-dependent epimerase/dehydratase family protein [Planctomycetia bacterium]|nr:NAD-dependent epimerase/dehydratase family protein [Planctomycetia bacterium]
MKTILLTGSAGFIGFHAAQKLIERGDFVLGIDNLNDYYDIRLKKDRLNHLKTSPQRDLFRFEKIDFSDRKAVSLLFRNNNFSHVIHLGAQAGVRYSLTHPEAYIKSNMTGFYNILEECRQHSIKLTFASSSSVYGNSNDIPFSIQQRTDQPISLYAATKKSNELLAFSYSHLYDLPIIGLRFFTVYGPWGRPDMAIFRFVDAILNKRPVDIYHFGQMRRDFTYIDDVIDGLLHANDLIPDDCNLKSNLSTPTSFSPQQSSKDDSPKVNKNAIQSEHETLSDNFPKTMSVIDSNIAAIDNRRDNVFQNANEKAKSASIINKNVPFRLYNLGNHQPVELLYLIEIIEKVTGIKAIKNLLPMQPGDVQETFADIDESIQDLQFHPKTTIEEGISHFVQWFNSYYHR